MKPISILVVDDEPELRELVARLLRNAGYSVTERQDGNGAVKALEESAFDLIVTDIVMPDMDGLELIVRLRKAKEDIPILALSGGGRTRNLDVLQYAEKFGANAALAKPFRQEELLAKVEQILKG